MNTISPSPHKKEVRKPVVALVGNPNAGKTTIFNCLTGAEQRVGNYAGVTVEIFSSELHCCGIYVNCIDVPGLYSLNPISMDEEVATDVLSGCSGLACSPDLLVCVIDATNLERNLYFFTQIAESGKPVIVVLSMTDVLAKHYQAPAPKKVGKYAHLQSLDTLKKSKDQEYHFGRQLAQNLSKILKIDVIPVVAHKKEGIDELRVAIESNLKNPKIPQLDLPDNHDISDTTRRYTWASEVRSKVITDEIPSKLKEATDKIDAILTHKVFGLAIFVSIMLVLFETIYAFAQPIMSSIEWFFEKLGSAVGGLLEGSPLLQSLAVNGIIQGVGAVLTFLPQIAILFFFIGVLESTGYLARAAFLMDKLLGWCGLNGRAFIPLLSSYACAIPGIMAARVIPDKRSRLATILVAPLMSCSARLPVYILLISAFFEPKFGAFYSGLALFGMHFLGLAIAIPLVWVLNRGVLKSNTLPFILELPSYQKPKWPDVFRMVKIRAIDFVKTAGTTIVVMSIIIWALLYFPRSSQNVNDFSAKYASLPQNYKESVTLPNYVQQQQIINSYLGQFGKAIEPIFIPAGFDWRLSTAILAAFPARENLVSSLGIIFQLGEDVDEESKDLQKLLQSAKWPDGKPLLTSWTAVGLMAFFALCCQCMATLAVVRRETGTWKWPVFMFSYMTIFAYIAAVIINYTSKLFA